jgi:hypothetical protein
MSNMEVVEAKSTVEYKSSPATVAPSNFKRKHDEMMARQASTGPDVDDSESLIVDMLHQTGAIEASHQTVIRLLRTDAARHRHDQELRNSLLEVASLYTLNGTLGRQNIGKIVAVAISEAMAAGKIEMVDAGRKNSSITAPHNDAKPTKAKGKTAKATQVAQAT